MRAAEFLALVIFSSYLVYIVQVGVECPLVSSSIRAVFTLEVTFCSVFVTYVGFQLVILAKVLAANLTEIRAYPKMHLVDMFLMRQRGFQLHSTEFTSKWLVFQMLGTVNS